MAHNTLTIDDKITNSDGVGELIRSNKGNAKPFGIFDMSTSYEGQVSSVLRGFKLLSQDAVLIRDEITLKPGSKKVSWRFLTNAGVKIDGSTATLSQNGKKFYINCLLTDGFTIKSFPAKTNTPDEKPIKDVTIIEITVSPSKSTIAIPVLIGKDVQSFKTSSTDNSALSTWR